MTSPEIKKFKLTPEKQKELAIALEVPALKEAIALIKQAAMPSISNHLPSIQGLHHDSVVSRRYHEIFGAHDALNTLLTMVNPPIMQKDQEEDEPDFMHAIDKELQDNNNQ